MTLAAIQIVALASFLALGAAFPRRAYGIVHRDLLINVAHGAMLAAIKLIAATTLTFGVGPGVLPLGALPVPLQGLVAFLAVDFARWALHYAHHRVPMLWSFHRVHHSVEHLDASAGLRMHVVDFAQLALLPVLLFSVVLDTSGSPAWLVPAALAPGVIFDAFEHANLRFDAQRGLGRLWDRVLNNPHFHAWHHTADGHFHDGNYGNVLTVWDRLFGTCVSRPTLPERFGLSGDQRLRNDPVGLQTLRRV